MVTVSDMILIVLAIGTIKLLTRILNLEHRIQELENQHHDTDAVGFE